MNVELSFIDANGNAQYYELLGTVLAFETEEAKHFICLDSISSIEYYEIGSVITYVNDGLEQTKSGVYASVLYNAFERYVQSKRIDQIGNN